MTSFLSPLQHDLCKKSVEGASPWASAFALITSLPKMPWPLLSDRLPESHLIWEAFGISPRCPPSITAVNPCIIMALPSSVLRAPILLVFFGYFWL